MMIYKFKINNVLYNLSPSWPTKLPTGLTRVSDYHDVCMILPGPSLRFICTKKSNIAAITCHFGSDCSAKVEFDYSIDQIIEKKLFNRTTMFFKPL
jgi:hypothetical protein